MANVFLKILPSGRRARVALAATTGAFLLAGIGVEDVGGEKATFDLNTGKV